MYKRCPIKLLFLLSTLLCCCLSCRRYSRPAKDKVIVLQPLDGYDAEKTTRIQHFLEHFYRRRVVVFPQRKLPDAFIDRSKGKRYHANSILQWLAASAPDTALCVVGLTDADIFTTKRDKDGKVRQPEHKYVVWGIFGLGYCPGKACVVSDNRLVASGEERFRRRIRTVVLHEVGHNLGLPHCPHRGCIMSDANEKIATIDESGDTYCSTCAGKVGL